jgi:3-deoxy-manno-octulosonate cytidylyltransferase (CMP-KDO synthetase)
MSVLGVIPARLGSTRLPQKPLQPLGGVPLVVRVAERVRALGAVDELIVATDAAPIARVVEQAGIRAVLTSSMHLTGTERVAEVAARDEFASFDRILNIQGDEPFVPGEALAGALGRLELGDDVGTAAAPLDPAEADDPARVKVVVDVTGRALYFSRACIPFQHGAELPPAGLYWQHLGVYAYTRSALARWVSWPPALLEEAERLEQLRALAHGLRIGVARLATAALPGIDTPEDLRRAESHWLSTHGVPA